jgi:PAS domain S-box-containing protein
VIASRTSRLFGKNLAAFSVIVGAWLLLVVAGAAGPSVARLASGAGTAAAALVGALTCARAAHKARGRARIAWALLAAGVACWAGGEVVWSVYEELGLAPFPSPADIGYLGLPPLAAAALLAFATDRATPAAHIRGVVDGLLIGTSLFILGWLTVLGPLVADGQTSLATALGLAYPAGDIVLATVAAYVLVRRRQTGLPTPRHLALLTAGLIAISVADFGFTYLQTSEAYVSGSIIDTGWFVGFLLIAQAGRSSVVPAPTRTGTETPPRPLGIFLPYVAVAVGTGVGLREVLISGSHAVSAVWTFGVIVLLVIVRQVMILIENDSLTRHLESRVAERTAELVASEHRFRALVQRSSDVVAVVRPDGMIAYLSDSIDPVFGYRPEELVERSIGCLVDAAGWPVLQDELALAHGAASAIRVIELGVRHFSGELRQAEVTITNLLDEPTVAGFVLNTRDVTERRALEKQRAHDTCQQEALRRVATAVAGGIGTSELFNLVAREVAELLGVEAGLVCRFEGQDGIAVGWWGTAWDPTGTTFRLDGDGVLAGVHRTGRPARVDDYADLGDDPVAILAQKASFQCSVAAPVRVSGELWGAVLASARWQGLLPAGTEAWLGDFAEILAMAVANDATRAQRDQLAVDLRRAQRLEAVGQLAAGVAHEINTPIQFVGDSVDFLEDAFTDLQSLVERYRAVIEVAASGPAGAATRAEVAKADTAFDLDYLVEKVPEAISWSQEGVQRVAKIVRAMKDFARPSSNERAPADLNEAIMSTVTVASSEVKHAATVTTDFADLPPVLCDVGDIKQVVLNLLLNAGHAIADTPSAERGEIRVSTRTEGEMVTIAVSDTGCGIPPEARNRIFDPFFTTKAPGRGTGQGLAIAWALVVDKHHGSLTFESNPGEGTTFYVRLPIQGEPAARAGGEG